MKHRTKLVGLVVIALMTFVAHADAGWGSWGSGGSYGGSYGGCWGSGGGCWGSGGGSWGSGGGSWGSGGGSWGSGGGVFSRRHARHARHAVRRASYGSVGVSYASYGSGGSYGVSHASYGNYYGSAGAYSSVSSYVAPVVHAPVVCEPVCCEPACGVSIAQPIYDSGACDSCGVVGGYSSGAFTDYGVVSDGYVEGYSEGTYVDEGSAVIGEPAIEGGALEPAPAGDELPAGASEAGPEARLDSGLLLVSVPASAALFVNGYKTTSTGQQRKLKSSGLKPGRQYSYEVRAVLGDRAVTKFVKLTTGNRVEVNFDFEEAVTNETVVQLHVPEGAKVNLAGSEMMQSGPIRTFATRRLAPGKTWEDYVVRVTVVENGNTLTKERKLTIRGGESYELKFDFNESLVAVR